MSDDRDGKFRTQIASGRLSSECTAGVTFEAGVETADCKPRRRSLAGLLDRRDEPLFVELQLLGLRELDRLVVLYRSALGDSEPDLVVFVFATIVLEEHSVSDVRRSVVVSYALSGVLTTAALAKLPYRDVDWLDDDVEFSYHEFDVCLCKMLEFVLSNCEEYEPFL